MNAHGPSCLDHAGRSVRGRFGQTLYQAARRMLGHLAVGACWAPLAWAAPEVPAADALTCAAVTQEAEAFAHKIKSGELAAMSSHAIKDAYRGLRPEAIAAYLAVGIQPYNEYEIWLRRQERLPGGWTRQPFLNYIKYRHQPRRVYMKWLQGGPKAGQEIIYDETRRRDAMFGHFGGWLNVMPMWIPIDGALAKENSNHTVRDLGMQAIVEIVGADCAQYVREGLRPAPEEIDVDELDHERTVVLTWKAARGKPLHYAKKTKIYLDLKRPLIKQIEAWDDEGELVERIRFQSIAPATFTDADFDPKNPAYGF